MRAGRLRKGAHCKENFLEIDQRILRLIFHYGIYKLMHPAHNDEVARDLEVVSAALSDEPAGAG